MIVSNELARELLFLDEGDDTKEWDVTDIRGDKLMLEVIKSTLVDSGRWSLVYERIYKDLDTGKFYSTSYRVAATECQDERPYENDGPEVEFTEVVAREKVVIEYVRA